MIQELLELWDDFEWQVSHSGQPMSSDTLTMARFIEYLRIKNIQLKDKPVEDKV